MSSYPVRKSAPHVSNSPVKNETEVRPYQIMAVMRSESEDDKVSHIEREESRKSEYTKKPKNKVSTQKESYQGSRLISRSSGSSDNINPNKSKLSASDYRNGTSNQFYADNNYLASIAEMLTDQKREASQEPLDHTSRPYRSTSPYSFSAVTDGSHPYPSSLSGSPGLPFAPVNSSTSRRRDLREASPEQPINRTARTISTSPPTQGDKTTLSSTSPERQTRSARLSKDLPAYAVEESRTDDSARNNRNIQNSTRGCNFDIRSTSLRKQDATGPFRECYDAFYNEFTREVHDYEAFASLEQLVVFLEVNRDELGSSITSVLPSLIKMICEKVPGFDWPFVENYNFNGDNFYGSVNPSNLLADLDAGLGVRIVNYYRSAFDPGYTSNPTIVKTTIEENKSERDSVANLRYAVIDRDEEEEAKDFLNFLAELDENSEDTNEEDNLDVTSDESEYESGKITQRSISENENSKSAKRLTKGKERTKLEEVDHEKDDVTSVINFEDDVDYYIDPVNDSKDTVPPIQIKKNDGTESDSSFEEVEHEYSDVESVCTTSSESGWAHVSKNHYP